MIKQIVHSVTSQGICGLCETRLSEFGCRFQQLFECLKANFPISGSYSDCFSLHYAIGFLLNTGTTFIAFANLKHSVGLQFLSQFGLPRQSSARQRLNSDSKPLYYEDTHVT